jgi:hypothetical protein
MFSGKTALKVATSELIQGIFCMETLQSVMMGDAERTADLLLAGVRPNDRVGPGSDSKSLHEWAVDLTASTEGRTMGSNPAAELLLRQANDALRITQKHVSTDLTRPTSALETSSGSVSPGRRTNANADSETAHKFEEQVALIARLRSSLQEMAEEQEVLKRLVPKQGSTSMTEPLVRLRNRVGEVRLTVGSPHGPYF